MDEDLIKRENATEVIYNALRTPPLKGVFTDTMSLAVAMAQDIPSADRPQGEWIINISDYKSICSVCGANEAHFIYGTEMWYGLGKSRFCPYCGARMKGAVNEIS